MISYLTATSLFSCFLLLCYITESDGKTAEEWKSRVIYQILTDRFSHTGTSPSMPCTDLRSYCGGTFNGITNNLDYIQGLGANAIWISPMVENTPGGFHGYWAKNIYKINPHFGSEEDLKNLISECHRRDIWVMLDVVANHMGYPYDCLWSKQCTREQLLNFTGFVPFDKDSHYHELCEIKDFSNQTEVELCRLAQLPDLNQTNTFVRSTLLAWIKNLTEYYGFDGYRIDTVVEVEKGFWWEFQQAAGAYCLGEANNGRDIPYTAGYQGPLDAVLNFPAYWALRDVFEKKKSFLEFHKSLTEQRKHFNDTSVLGLFIDNHDFPRFLHLSPDIALLHNALTYVLLGEGVPIVYYGTEQEFAGKYDPENRESLWPYQNSSSRMYKFIGHLAKFRLQSRIDFRNRNQRELFVDNDTMVFSRGNKNEAVVFLTRRGHRSGIHTKTFTNMTRFTDGTVLQNIFDCSDTVTITGGSVTVTFKDGLPLIYVEESSAGNTVCGTCVSQGNSCDSNGESGALFDAQSYIISLILTFIITFLFKNQN